MVVAANFLRALGSIGGGNNALTRAADVIDPRFKMEQERLELQRLGQNADLEIARGRLAESREKRKQAERGREAQNRFLGTLQEGFATPGFNPEAGLSPQMVVQGLQAGVSPTALGTLQDALAPELTQFEENIQTLDALQKMSPENQELYARIFGKGGTTVNVGGQGDAFGEKFNEELGKQSAKRIGELNVESQDFASQAAGSAQALKILSDNPDIDISPTSKITTQGKALFAPFLSEDELENIADYQTLESQLIRNRFDVTKVLKGAITEQEQQAAQTVAGSATGTRQGLEKTLLNNIAFAELQADERARRAQYIREMGADYSPSKFKASCVCCKSAVL